MGKSGKTPNPLAPRVLDQLHAVRARRRCGTTQWELEIVSGPLCAAYFRESSRAQDRCKLFSRQGYSCAVTRNKGSHAKRRVRRIKSGVVLERHPTPDPSFVREVFSFTTASGKLQKLTIDVYLWVLESDVYLACVAVE